MMNDRLVFLTFVRLRRMDRVALIFSPTFPHMTRLAFERHLAIIRPPTCRRDEVDQLLLEGYSDQVIANHLGMKPRRVAKYRRFPERPDVLTSLSTRRRRRVHPAPRPVISAKERVKRRKKRHLAIETRNNR